VVSRRTTPKAGGLGVGAIVEAAARRPVATARTVRYVPSAAVGFVRALRDASRSVTLPLSAPRTSLNRSITSARAVSLTTLPLTDVREVTEAFGLTLNDVATAMCAGALRSWLEDVGELPGKALVAAVPVAVRGGDAHLAGNKMSVLFASIPTHLADPRARLDASRDEMRDAKATHRDVGPYTLGAIADAAPWNLVSLLFRGYSNLGLASRLPPPVNLVFSNVPGPEVPVYCGGARLTALFALGPIFDGAALNVTIVTCDDDVDVGVVTCPDVVPAPVDSLGKYFDTALGELVALARTAP
jgi:WS/DGAT/MGAT family acyltransferase